MGRLQTTAAVLTSCFGWLLSYTYSIHPIGAYTHTCTMGNDQPHQTAMVLGPATLLLSAALIWAGKEQSRRLRWLLLPHVVTVVVALWLLPRYLLLCTLSNKFVCAASSFGGWEDEPAALWHSFYAPAHVFALAVCFWSAARFWRRAWA